MNRDTPRVGEVINRQPSGAESIWRLRTPQSRILGALCVSGLALSASVGFAAGKQAGRSEMAPLDNVTETSTVEATEEATEQPEQELPPLDELQLLIVEANGSLSKKPEWSHSYIKQQFELAGEQFERHTDGAVGMPDDIPVHVLSLTPNGLYTDSEGNRSTECFTTDQIYEARQNYLDNTGQELARTAMVINGTALCEGPDRLTVSYVNRTIGTSVYNLNVFEPTQKLILHEEGHLEGLGHAGSFKCELDEMSIPYELERREDLYTIDIAELIEYGCDAVRVTEGERAGEVNHGGSALSVMGSRMDSEVLAQPLGDLFNVVEMNKLAPEAVVNSDITVEAGRYRLSMEPGEARMLTLSLPEEHPLHKIDESIARLSVGITELQVGKNETQGQVSMVAHGGHHTYDLSQVFSGYPLDSARKQGTLELYRDRALGVRVIASPPADTDSIRSVDIIVVPYEYDGTPKGVESLGSLAQSVN